MAFGDPDATSQAQYAADVRYSKEPDVRASITTKGGASLDSIFPGASAGPMKALLYDRGVVFPYVPTIMAGFSANYGKHQPIHSNFTYKFFQNYEMQDITVTGNFTAHTTVEGQYMEAAMLFFKSAMKIGFGDIDPQRGVPPPVLEFNAWGEAWMKKVPVVLTNFTYNIDGSVDYTWPVGEGSAPSYYDSMMPLKVQFILNLSPTYSTKSTRIKFTTEKFYNGSLLSKGYL